MNKYRLPSREVFDKYEPAVRSNLIKEYHRKLTQRHRWFVRSLDDYFYCDGEERPSIPGVEIFDCDWTPEEWNTRPYRHFYNPIQEAWYRSFAHEGLPPLCKYDYGYVREDSKIMRDDETYFIRFNIPGRMVVNWSPLDEGSSLTIVYKGVYSRYYGGVISQGVFEYCNPVKKAKADVIIPVIREIIKEKYNGVYIDVSRVIIERFDIPSNSL